MFRRFGLLCAVLAIFSIAGGQWAVLQSVAWAQMVVDYSQRSGSFTVGIKQTFDGQHACQLCQAIQAEKSKAKDQTATSGATNDAKVKALATDGCVPIPERTAVGVMLFCAVCSDFSNRVEPPPTPPPRRVSLAACRL